jgi:hypothetical protein
LDIFSLSHSLIHSMCMYLKNEKEHKKKEKRYRTQKRMLCWKLLIFPHFKKLIEFHIQSLALLCAVIPPRSLTHSQIYSMSFISFMYIYIYIYIIFPVFMRKHNGNINYARSKFLFRIFLSLYLSQSISRM